MAKFSRNAEVEIENILKRNSPSLSWELFVPNGGGAQYKMYNESPLSYPDFEGRRNNSLLILVEVKSSWGYFDNRNGYLALTNSHFEQYKKVSLNESVPIKIVFVVKTKWKNAYYWQDIFVLDKSPSSREMYEWKYKNSDGSYTIKNRLTKIFHTKVFRADIKNLGLL